MAYAKTYDILNTHTGIRRVVVIFPSTHSLRSSNEYNRVSILRDYTCSC